jgi:hypothetical protein
MRGVSLVALCLSTFALLGVAAPAYGQWAYTPAYPTYYPGYYSYAPGSFVRTFPPPFTPSIYAGPSFAQPNYSNAATFYAARPTSYYYAPQYAAPVYSYSPRFPTWTYYRPY